MFSRGYSKYTLSLSSAVEMPCSRTAETESNAGPASCRTECKHDSFCYRGRIVDTKTNDVKNLSKKKLLWTLFRSTFTLSAFTFGGGYVIVPLMRKMFVDTYHWIDEQEMLDLIAIAQASPGPMAVNTSILVGYKLAGVVGALCTLLGTVLPPLVLLTAISYLYAAIKGNIIVQTLFYGMSIGVAVVILDAVVTMGKTIVETHRVVPILIMIAAFIATYALHVNIVIIIAVCAVLGVISTFYDDIRKKRKNARSETDENGGNAQ